MGQEIGRFGVMKQRNPNFWQGWLALFYLFVFTLMFTFPSWKSDPDEAFRHDLIRAFIFAVSGVMAVLVIWFAMRPVHPKPKRDDGLI